jgi:hypothetical protein
MAMLKRKITYSNQLPCAVSTLVNLEMGEERGEGEGGVRWWGGEEGVCAEGGACWNKGGVIAVVLLNL